MIAHKHRGLDNRPPHRSKPPYAAFWKSSTWRIQLVSGFHLGKIWATNLFNSNRNPSAVLFTVASVFAAIGYWARCANSCWTCWLKLKRADGSLRSRNSTNDVKAATGYPRHAIRDASMFMFGEPLPPVFRFHSSNVFVESLSLHSSNCLSSSFDITAIIIFRGRGKALRSRCGTPTFRQNATMKPSRGK